MLSDEVVDMLTEKLVQRIQDGNVYVLKKIGKAIKEIGTLNATQAQQLAQILKYGGSYREIVYKLTQITNLNIKEIEAIFEEVALQNIQFAKQFYDYRGMDFVPYKYNEELQRQVKAIANRAIYEYMDLSRTTALGIVRTNELGKNIFVPLQKAYFEAIDEAVLSVAQGKDTFDNQMYKTIKEIGGSGLKVQYESGHVRRLDSAVRMNLKEGLRNMSNELQNQFGEEYGADGVEISAHENPAEDHALLQGRQFSKEEYDKLNAGMQAKTYDNIIIPADDRRRPISTLNCYHYIFNIVLGVSEPQYDKNQLQKIIDDNNEGFELDGKHYTLYDGTQMQRKLETEIRKQKDIQIMGVASGNKQVVDEAQQKISQLTMKYKELSEKSGLPTRMERMRVSGYKRKDVSKVGYITDYNAIYKLEKKSDEWWNTLDRDEQKAIYRYTGGLNVDINTYLIDKENRNRFIEKEMLPVVEDNIKEMDKALNKFKLEDNIIAYRKAPIKYVLGEDFDIKNIDNYKNAIQYNKGFISTSVLEEKAKKFRGDTYIKFRIPKGTKGAYLGEHSQIVEEREFLLARNSKYIINEIIQKDNIIYIDATIL